MELTQRARTWAATMGGYGADGVVVAHADSAARISARPMDRLAREAREAAWLQPGATLSHGAGNRATPEAPDPVRTCFERDRDRIVHSTAFRRLAGKTQVVVFPSDHQRTRLTHALEVAQVATAIARGIGANETLADAIALGHDCGHGPGGHASEDALSIFLPYDHGPWGADVVLAPLNLCFETLDGIRHHSWSSPAPATIEGEIVSWADRIAYCAHDLEDAVRASVVALADIPDEVVAVCGRTRREQLAHFINAMISTTVASGRLSLDPQSATALARLREFNYERIYTRPASVAQAEAVIAVLRALVEHYIANPELLPLASDDVVRAAVTHVGAMTDRYAFAQAVELLDWPVTKLPQVAS